MNIVSVTWAVVCIMTGIFAYVLCRKKKHGAIEGCPMSTFMTVVFVMFSGFVFASLVSKTQHAQFCRKYQIDRDHTDFYRNNADSPVLVHVATYGTFSGEREQSVIVPPGQVRYFGRGKVLWVDSE